MSEEIMSQEAFDEIIDNLEHIKTLTDYGKKGIKYNIKKLQEELKQEKERAEELLKDREKSTEEYIHNNPWLYKQLAESYVLKSDVEKNYISKDRIREKIDFLENGLETSNEDINYKLRIEDKAQKQVLKELLEEE